MERLAKECIPNFERANVGSHKYMKVRQYKEYAEVKSTIENQVAEKETQLQTFYDHLKNVEEKVNEQDIEDIASDEEEVEDALQLLSWAARLHEVGISVAHSSYHKHSAYILGNADMPGFSNMEQAQLSELVLSHQGSLTKVSEFLTNPINLAQSIALRLATLFYRSRMNIELPQIKVEIKGYQCRLIISQAWLEQNPLTETLLQAEIDAWKKVDWEFRVVNP